MPSQKQTVLTPELLDWLQRPVVDLPDLPEIVVGMLDDLGAIYIEQVLALQTSTLLAMPGFGMTRLRQLRRSLAAVGFVPYSSELAVEESVKTEELSRALARRSKPAPPDKLRPKPKPKTKPKPKPKPKPFTGRGVPPCRSKRALRSAPKTGLEPLVGDAVKELAFMRKLLKTKSA